MKKILCVVLALAILASVPSGCCIKHDWEDATCVAPMTCKECGKTKEATGDHDPSYWCVSVMDDGTMVSDCELCGGEIIEELDFQKLASSQIVGRWELGGRGKTEGVDEYIEFFADGTLSYTTNAATGSGTWEWESTHDDEILRAVKEDLLMDIWLWASTSDSFEVKPWDSLDVDYTLDPSWPKEKTYVGLTRIKIVIGEDSGIIAISHKMGSNSTSGSIEIGGDLSRFSNAKR